MFIMWSNIECKGDSCKLIIKRNMNYIMNKFQYQSIAKTIQILISIFYIPILYIDNELRYSSELVLF